METVLDVAEAVAGGPGYATHEVLNQSGELDSYDAYGDDLPLVEAIRVFGAGWAAPDLHRTGALVGSAQMQHLAR